MSPHSAWVIPTPKKSIVVGVADMLASNDSNSMIVTHSLGSCVGITAYDPVKKAGGLLHCMLPDSSIAPDKVAQRPFMFADTGLPRLFHAVYALGCEKHRLIVKIAGGAQILDGKGVFNIGERNTAAVRQILQRNGVAVHASDTGGVNERTIRLDLSTGNLSVQTAGAPTHSL